VAADRGVLDLIDFHLPDPLQRFYDPGLYRNGVAHYDSRAMLIDPVLWKVRDLPGGDKEGAEAGAEGLPELRRDFRATAVFEPSLVTGPDGSARLRFRLPDQLSTFRVTAVAVRQQLFGLGEAEIQVRNPINVRTALPRVLRSGDRATAGVVLTNLDARRQTVRIRLEAEGLEGRGEQTVTLASGETREVAFSLRAGEPGTARLQFTVDSPVLQERLQALLVVQRGTLQEAFTVVGQTEGQAREGLAVPASFLGRGQEGLELSLDSTIASSLREAVRFLESYPYDCLEQRTSKLFAWLLYGWMLDPQTAGRVDAELRELARYQTAGGGMSFWAQRPRPDYYVSLRTAHLLGLARGRALPAALDRDGLLQYLSEEYAEQRPYLQSYCLYVLSLGGRDVGSEARALLASGRELGVTEWAFLGLALQQSGRRPEAEAQLGRIRDSLRVSARSVSLSGPAPWYGYHGGELQAKALVLMLYQALEPRSQIAQALADDLLAGSRQGRWGNTSQTAWALEAFAAWQAGEPEADFRARVSLGPQELAAQSFRGPSKQPFTRRIGAPELLEMARAQGGAVLPLSFTKAGRGRLYYAATLRYALEATGAEARDEGIGLHTEMLDAEGRPAGPVLRLGQV